MTDEDEERAEEYASNEISKMFADESEEVYVRASTLKQVIKNSHLKGLAEGRKENFDFLICEQEHVEMLEKENAELKEKVADLTAEREHHLNLMKGLNARIDSMKCCQNCKKERNKPEPLAVHISCMKCKNHSEWELVE